MRCVILVAALVQAVLGGGSEVAVRLPYLNPAGVTYVNGPAPVGLAAGPGYVGEGLGYAAPAALGYAGHAGFAAPGAVGYADHAGFAAPGLGYAAPAAVGYAGHAGFAAPAAVGYAGHAGYAAPAAVGYANHAALGVPAAYGAPAYAGYAAAAVPAVAAVPTVHHVPGVADVPVTRVEAQHGVIQKLVDVAKPAVSTRKFELRRPAIQKQFYDVEERVVIRPVGSALVELEEPLAKIQRGPAVINPVGAVAVGHHAPAVALSHGPAVAFGHGPAVAIGHAPLGFASTPAPVLVSSTPAPVFVSTTPAPVFGDYGPVNPGPGAPGQFQDDFDSVSVENPDFGRAAAQQQFAEQRAQNVQGRQALHTEARYQPQLPLQGPAVEVRAHGSPLEALVPAPHAGGAVVPSLRNLSPELNQANQQRLIQLVTARGGVSEIGFGRAGPSDGPVGDAGHVRARVLSATAAPPHVAPAGERVSTRRVVVSRPIETVQEIDVVEPVTKLERVAVNHPTVFKTLRHDVARVPTSVPVLGKTLHHTYAHAAVPVAHAAVPVAHAGLQYGFNQY